MDLEIYISFFSLHTVQYPFFHVLLKNNNTDEIANPDSNTPQQTDPNVIPQFVNTDYIELNKIGQISKFQSASRI